MKKSIHKLHKEINWDPCVETKGKVDAVDSNTTSSMIILDTLMAIPTTRTQVQPALFCSTISLLLQSAPCSQWSELNHYCIFLK